MKPIVPAVNNGYLYDLFRKIGLSDFGARTGSFILEQPVRIGLTLLAAWLASRFAVRAIRRFASIVAGAWEYILHGHEDEAVKAIIAQRPQAKLDAKVLRAQIDSLKAFFTTPNSKGNVKSRSQRQQ